MEALASSAVVPETHPVVRNSPTSIRTPKQLSGSLKISQSSHLVRLRARAVGGEASGSGESEELWPLNNGFGLLSGDMLSLSQDNVNHLESSEKNVDEALKVDTSLTPPSASGAGGGTRAGLFRTPISGGVQSATTAHGLPRPA